MTLLRERPLLSWQRALIDGFKDSEQLLKFLSIKPEYFSIAAQQQFKTRVPRTFAAKMRQGDPHDPLLLQVLASPVEMVLTPGYGFDPLKEQASNPVAGLIHKYHGRILLTVSGSCAINCRYCFRRHFPYNDNQLSPVAWQEVLTYIANHPEIEEVILSGGDPLMLNDNAFSAVVERLTTLPQLKTLRIHSRIPTVLPQRITKTLGGILNDSPFHVVMVVHCNHPNEIDDDVKLAMRILAESGVHRLNQSVLLKGVNDSLGTLTELSKQLFDAGILPYYLHLLDKVAGASHFDIERDVALQLYRQLLTCLPGYLVPKLVEEVPGEKSKSQVSS